MSGVISTGGTGPVSDVPDEAADRIDEAIWRLAIEGLSQYDIQRIVRMVVLPEVAAERQRLHDRIEAARDGGPTTGVPSMDRFLDGWDAALDHLLAALVSPVSDDTGGTKP